MSEFRTSLLREKFTIKPDSKSENSLTALSNRIVIHLVSEDKVDNEVFVVRTQNMHSCARFAASIIKEFYEHGSIINGLSSFPWKEIWTDVIKGYEKEWNPNIWCAVYYKGKIVYENGKHHPFLDIIEKCDTTNKEEYSQSISLAENAFSKAGKNVQIEHNSNIALVISTRKDQAKCGVIIRSASGATTFNYTITPNKEHPHDIRPHTTLTVAASFLEAIQLAFKAGLMQRKLEYKLIKENSDEHREYIRTNKRLENLERAITNYQVSYDVLYRPERPDFSRIVEKAYKKSAGILKSQVENKLSSGELDRSEWIF